MLLLKLQVNEGSRAWRLPSLLMYSSYNLGAYAAKAPVKPNGYFCVGYGTKGYPLLPKPAIETTRIAMIISYIGMVEEVVGLVSPSQSLQEQVDEALRLVEKKSVLGTTVRIRPLK